MDTTALPNSNGSASTLDSPAACQATNSTSIHTVTDSHSLSAKCLPRRIRWEEKDWLNMLECVQSCEFASTVLYVKPCD